MAIKRKQPEVLPFPLWLWALLLAETRTIYLDGYSLHIRMSNMLYEHRRSIDVGSKEWHEWIEKNTRITFDNSEARCLLLKERVGNHYYWYAYKWHTNKRKPEKVYIGKLANYSPEEIIAKAMELERRAKMSDADLARSEAARARYRAQRHERQHKARSALRDARAKRGTGSK